MDDTIMRKLLPIAAWLAAVLALPAWAQQPPPNEAPPKTEILDESEQPVTIRKPETAEREITERRDRGQLKEVKVKSGGSTYYLKPKGSAAAPPDDAHGGEISVPMWTVKEFDIGQKQEAEKKPVQEPVLPPAPAK